MALAVPQSEIEVVHCLLEQPRPDARAVVAPAVSARAIEITEQVDVHVQRITDRVVVDQRLDARPLRRLPELVTDRDEASSLALGHDQPIAVIDSRRHRLFEQHILACTKRTDRDVGVHEIRSGDVDDVDIVARNRVAPVADDHR